MAEQANTQVDPNLHRKSAPFLRDPEHSSRLPFANHIPSHASPLKLFASSSTSKSAPPKDSQKAWQKDYLTDLRNYRPPRPSGSRPLPNRDATASPIPRPELPLRTSSAMSRRLVAGRETELDRSIGHDRSSSALSYRRAQLAMPTIEAAATNAGRPLIQPPQIEEGSRDVSDSTLTRSVTPTIAYRESGMRWMEKQEARSLREALEDMDLQDDERLHAVAQREASELVWQHRNPSVPRRNPDAPYSYTEHLRKGSHARSQNVERYGGLGSGKRFEETSHRSVSDGSTSQKSDSSASGGSRKSSGSAVEAKKAHLDATSKGHSLWDSPEKKSYLNLSFQLPSSLKSSHRRTSGPKSRKSSGGLFRNPGDKIYEEPGDIEKGPESGATKDVPVTSPLKPKARNSISQLPIAKQTLLRSATAPVEESMKLSKFEIHNNPPSQSRNPSYVKNPLPPSPPDSGSGSDNDGLMVVPGKKDGIEIRSDEIRAATSLRMKDRSPKLPSPTVVSDQKGRPIVSFDLDWKPCEADTKRGAYPLNHSSSRDGVKKAPSVLCSKPQLLVSTVSSPAIPTISIAEPPTIQLNDTPAIPSINISSVPSIAVSRPENPTISIQETPSIALQEPTKPRPLPFPSSKSRPLLHHSSTDPTRTSRPHWSPIPSNNRPTAQCAACALPISGRIVSAASQRFHPSCFTCFHCSELLECVAFYPEPSTARDARLKRIVARANDDQVPSDDVGGTSAEADGDNGLRFYCHLDFHEHFSPRCRSCKTPIEGEVVVACGGEWHVGHFFCAECGDPFDKSTPFVEREGFAWCVGCHTRRFSGKCRGCRRPITDLVVQALGGEWHEGCFCCKVRLGFCLRFSVEVVGHRCEKGLTDMFGVIGVRRGFRGWEVFH